jgi:2,3-bisphosphoglycerate-independent phosphoglycerate mutase
MMIDPVTKKPHTAHTLNPVHAIVASDEHVGRKVRPGGVLADIAPTVLEVMGLPRPPEMTGHSLLVPV